MKQAFSIGSVIIDPPIILAPMEDVTNYAFRRVVQSCGRPGLFVTEFISAMAAHYNVDKQLDKMTISPDERPIAVQIFGADPMVMAETALKAQSSGADICDINMGCWVPKVCKTGAGAALLKNPELAIEIASSVVAAVKIPVTVKIRAGWDQNNINAVELGKALEKAGVKAITLHARTASQRLHSQSDWRLIKELKQNLSIPIIGNGDVKKPHDALRMFEETGCDGVMIGRACIGAPWFIGHVLHYLRTGETLPSPTLSRRIQLALDHLTLLAETMGDEKRAVRHLRGQMPIYIKGFHGAARIRELLSKADSIAEVWDILSCLQNNNPIGG